MCANYWQTIQTVDWGSMGHGEKQSFDEVVKFFPQFDLIGDLIAFLLSEDFACAGKFTMPSLAEMDGHLKEISAGAMGCMLLQSTIDEADNTGQCCTTFEEFYRYLDQELSKEEKSKLNFSTVILEHCMCKYYKAVTYSLFTQYFIITTSLYNGRLPGIQTKIEDLKGGVGGRLLFIFTI